MCAASAGRQGSGLGAEDIDIDIDIDRYIYIYIHTYYIHMCVYISEVWKTRRAASLLQKFSRSITLVAGLLEPVSNVQAH